MEHWHTRSIEELMMEFDSQFEGITGKQGGDRLEKNGFNLLEGKKKTPLWLRILFQLKDPMILVLLGAAALSFVASGGEDWLDGAIILLIVMVNNFIALSQEDHAEKALDALKNMTSPTATVVREGKEQKIPAKLLVTGDILVLRTGDMVPADGRLIHAVSLQVDESAMTGESVPVEKKLSNGLAADLGVGDWTNMVISGTLITGGHGRALVVATGMDTQMGKIASLLQKTKEQPSPLQLKMAEVSKVLSFLCLAVCAVMFGVGLLQGTDILDMFMTAVALAVAAIPEGLPAVVSIVLALGMSRMAEQGAIVKKLPAVETLGSASVICSDKTGTLTQNKMTVQECYVLTGTRRKDALQCALLCSNASIDWKGGAPLVTGSPTESALALYSVKEGIDRDKLAKELPKVEEIPFDSERKLMSTLHPCPDGGYIVYVKGAPDILLRQCTHTLKGAINGKDRQEITDSNEAMARKAMRVIGVAQRKVAFLPAKLTAEWVEQGLTFLGLFGITDPPRPEVKEAVAQCHRAGVRPVMITGDHRATAIAVATQLDIFRQGDWAVTGAELDFMPQSVLEQDIARFSVFARVSPEHKMRIVNAWQKSGRVVAVTGDGVNDAPALKAADIGCAMGISGNDVAKGASDMILTNDNFNNIVEAIEEGRTIYTNIRKAIHYLLSCNIGEIVTLFVATLCNFTTMPLVPVQLLWLNLVTDTLPALALGVETPEHGTMEKPPRSESAGMFDKEFSTRLAWQGIMVGLLTLSAYGLGFVLAPVETAAAVANTMAFATLTLSQLFHAFNVRSESESLLTQGMFSNPSMNKAFLVGLALQLAVLTISPLQAVFSVVSMNSTQWCTVFALALVPIPICEASKIKIRSKAMEGKRLVSSKEWKQLQASHMARLSEELLESQGTTPTLEEQEDILSEKQLDLGETTLKEGISTQTSQASPQEEPEESPVLAEK